MALSDHTFVVVDTETTGTDPAEDRIIEIGAVRVQGGSITDRFEQLVDPGRTVPRSITRLTGITQGMVQGQPPISEALRAFKAWAGGAPLVAHNAGFDQRFLALEGLRTESATFEEPFLCTLRLARRLLPGLPSKGLDALREFYGLDIARRHRAMDDADLTGKVLIRLFPHAEAAGARDMEALSRLQAEHYATSGAVSRRLERLRTERIPQAPEQPGVYRFWDSKGRLLYVGKARSLRDRLRQYVVAVEALPARTRRMVARIHEVSWEVFETELQAMLHESRAIKEDRPRHNRAQRRYRRRPFLRLHDGEVVLRTVIRRDGASYRGPMASTHVARVLAELLDALFGRRYANRPSVRTPLDRERREHTSRAAGWLRRVETAPGSEEAFLDGDVAAVRAALEVAMSAASRDFDFEAAATLRDWGELLSRRARRPGELAPKVFDQDAFLAATHQDRAPEFAVLRGGLPVAFGNDPAQIDQLLEAASSVPVPQLFGNAEAEEAHVVAHWSHLHREEITVMLRGAGESWPGFQERVTASFAVQV